MPKNTTKTKYPTDVIYVKIRSFHLSHVKSKHLTLRTSNMVNITLRDFLDDHRSQLQRTAVPKFYWETLYKKLIKQTFDAANTFSLIQIQYKEGRGYYDPPWQLQVKLAQGIQCNDPSHIYLVDHAWTFRMEHAYKQLEINGQLRERMATIIGIDSDLESTELSTRIFNDMWKYCNFYSIGSATNLESRVHVWFIMDEVGSAIQHSDTPNFRMVPFVFVPEQLGLSLIFPITDLNCGDIITKDFIEGIKDKERRSALCIPWKQASFSNISFDFVQHGRKYFSAGHLDETLPLLENLQTPRAKKDKYRVFCQYKLIKRYLKDPRFAFTNDEDVADILWCTESFNYYLELSQTPHKLINQFPYEYILTIKHLFSITCRRKNNKNFDDKLEGLPYWLPVTYNLQTEAPQFVAYYQKREEFGLNNLWIIKPFNLGESVDMHISNNLNYLMRSATTKPKVVQKYVDNPVLFHREEVGDVKFDLRYVLLLRKIKPLDIYVYKNFFLRFANLPFQLALFNDYERHYTVINYTEQATLKHMECSKFIEMWNKQYPECQWKDVEESIFQIFKDVFECAAMAEPPCGIFQNPQSRSLYTADIILSWRGKNIQPQIIEMNGTPDCERACQYYKTFFDDVFKCLFLDEFNTETVKQL